MKIIEKLSTYAALIGVIGAIGGGFYTWGQFNTRLDAIEKKKPVNLKTLYEKDKELTQQFDEVLLYANEYKVDLIDRIAAVEEKIKPTDLSGVKKEIARLREEVAALDIPKAVVLDPIYNSIKAIEALVAEASKQIAIALKENELQDIQIKEIKKKADNPLNSFN